MIGLDEINVEIPAKRKPKGSGAGAHGILRLVDVLHVPSSLCNIIGNPILEDHNVTIRFDEDSHGNIIGLNGQKVAYFEPNRPLFVVRLSGPPVGPQVGPPVIQHGNAYYINAYWEDSEWERWLVHKCSTASSRGAYTPEEKTWLKR